MWKSGAVDLSNDSFSAASSLEKSHVVFLLSNSSLFKTKERNGVIMVVLRCSPKMKLTASMEATLHECFGA